MQFKLSRGLVINLCRSKGYPSFQRCRYYWRRASIMLLRFWAVYQSWWEVASYAMFVFLFSWFIGQQSQKSAEENPKHCLTWDFLSALHIICRRLADLRISVSKAELREGARMSPYKAPLHFNWHHPFSGGRGIGIRFAICSTRARFFYLCQKFEFNSNFLSQESHFLTHLSPCESRKVTRVDNIDSTNWNCKPLGYEEHVDWLDSLSKIHPTRERFIIPIAVMFMTSS